jgi:hypothetical protein
VQDGYLIHREIVFDHLFHQRAGIVRIVKHRPDKMIGMHIHGCFLSDAAKSREFPD